MRKCTSRAFRATAAVAGVAALGASLVGTAVADETTDFGNEYGSSPSSDAGGAGDAGGSSESAEPGGLGSDVLSPSFDQGDLLGFEMPTSPNTNARSVNVSDDGDCGDHGDEYGDENNSFQNPVECEGNNFGDGKLGLLGEVYDVDNLHLEKDSSLRTADSDGPTVLSRDEGTDSEQSGDSTEATSLDRMMEGEGLSGHQMTVIPFG